MFCSRLTIKIQGDSERMVDSVLCKLVLGYCRKYYSNIPLLCGFILRILIVEASKVLSLYPKEVDTKNEQQIFGVYIQVFN